MPRLRFKALEDVHNRKPMVVDLPAVKTSEYFGINVFNKTKMQEYLSKEAYEEVQNSIDEGSKIDRKVANQVASGRKAWAIDRGATHYSN